MPLVARRLIDQIPGMTADRVFPSVWSDADHLSWPPADRFVTLFAHDFPVDQTDVTGGGTLNTAFDSRLRATLFDRVESDLENRSAAMLEQQVYGVYALTKQVIKALQLFDPVDSATGVGYFRWPMRVWGGWSIQPKSGKGNSRWAVIPINFVCSFVSDLGFGYDGTPI